MVTLRRPFAWGIVMLSDSKTRDIPSSPVASPFAHTPTALFVRVRHAADVEFDGADPDEVVPLCSVVVDVRVGEPADSSVDFEGTLQLPSGVLAVGDADGEELLELSPAAYRAQVRVDHPEYAENEVGRNCEHGDVIGVPLSDGERGK